MQVIHVGWGVGWLLEALCRPKRRTHVIKLSHCHREKQIALVLVIFLLLIRDLLQEDRLIGFSLYSLFLVFDRDAGRGQTSTGVIWHVVDDWLGCWQTRFGIWQVLEKTLLHWTSLCHHSRWLSVDQRCFRKLGLDYVELSRTLISTHHIESRLSLVSSLFYLSRWQSWRVV